MLDPGGGRAVAASALADLLTGPDRTGVVVGAGRRAVVVDVRSEIGPCCVCLLDAGAPRLPNGVQPVTALADVPAGTTVIVGGGVIRSSGLRVQVVRWWRSRVPVIRPSAAGLRTVAASVADADLGVPRGPVTALSDALTSTDPTVWTTAVDGLVGLGTGTTPGGDDILAGACVGLHAAGRRDLLDRLAAAGPADARGRTTALSAALLALAVRGEACGEALTLLRALHVAGRTPGELRAVGRAVDRLLSVGHTSGADLATGLLLGLAQRDPG